MNRRGFLGAILATCTAPAFPRAESLMRIVTYEWPITAIQRMVLPRYPQGAFVGARCMMRGRMYGTLYLAQDVGPDLNRLADMAEKRLREGMQRDPHAFDREAILREGRSLEPEASRRLFEAYPTTKNWGDTLLLRCAGTV